MKVAAIIERNNQGKCFIYTKEDFEEFLLTASGETPEDAQEDLYDVIKELKEKRRIQHIEMQVTRLMCISFE